MKQKKETNMGNSLGGLEDIFGKIMSEEVMKSLVQGIKEGVSDKPSAAVTDGWCHVNGDKPITSWMIMRVTTDGISDFSSSVAYWKKNLALFLKNLPEGQGLVFLPANFQIDTHSSDEGE